MDTGIIVNVVMGLLAMSGAWVAAYVAIRADLARLNEKVSTLAIDAVNLRERVDQIATQPGFDRRKSAQSE